MQNSSSSGGYFRIRRGEQSSENQRPTQKVKKKKIPNIKNATRNRQNKKASIRTKLKKY